MTVSVSGHLNFFLILFSHLIHVTLKTFIATPLFSFRSVQYISSNSTFPCNSMTFLCFLGALPASPVAHCMYEPHGVIQGLSCCTKHERNLKTRAITFYCDMKVTVEMNC